MYDFCSDLNAMHEAEKHSLSNIWHVYINELANATDSEDPCDHHFFCATARQRAEAFLRTLGKWNDQSGDATEMGKEVQK